MSDMPEIRLSKAIMFDHKGNSIRAPLCQECKSEKNMVYGKETYVWVCMNCDGKGNPVPVAKFCYRISNG